jgi:GNAT superfamily N-acetyltransferase
VTYTIRQESVLENTPELLPLYAQHYTEMQERLAKQGIEIPDFNPRLDAYFKAAVDGYFLNFVARTEQGEPVGYCNVYLTNDMHNGDLIAKEDTVFVRQDHRKGLGKKIVQFGLEELRKRGVTRLIVQATTDPRIVHLWKRMGFKEAAVCMVYRFVDK